MDYTHKVCIFRIHDMLACSYLFVFYTKARTFSSHCSKEKIIWDYFANSKTSSSSLCIFCYLVIQVVGSNLTHTHSGVGYVYTNLRKMFLHRSPFNIVCYPGCALEGATFINIYFWECANSKQGNYFATSILVFVFIGGKWTCCENVLNRIMCQIACLLCASPCSAKRKLQINYPLDLQCPANCPK